LLLAGRIDPVQTYQRIIHAHSLKCEIHQPPGLRAANQGWFSLQPNRLEMRWQWLQCISR
jgi:hypothetical protein